MNRLFRLFSIGMFAAWSAVATVLFMISSYYFSVAGSPAESGFMLLMSALGVVVTIDMVFDFHTVMTKEDV